MISQFYFTITLVFLAAGLVTLPLFFAYVQRNKTLSYGRDFRHYLLFFNLKMLLVIVGSYIDLMLPSSRVSISHIFVFLNGLSSIPMLVFLYRFTRLFFTRIPTSLEKRIAGVVCIALSVTVVSVSIFLVLGLYESLFSRIFLILAQSLFYSGLLFNITQFFVRKKEPTHAGIDRTISRLMRLAIVFFPLLLFEEFYQPFFFESLGLPPHFDVATFSIAYYFTFNGGILLLLYRQIRLPVTHINEDRKDLSSFAKSFAISTREEEVLQELLKGKTNKEIAESLFISPETVRNHLYRVFQKTRVKNRTELTLLIANSFK